MPQLYKPSVVQEIVSSQGEVTVKLEITLNINLDQEKIDQKPKLNTKIDYEIPTFEDTSELIVFGKDIGEKE